MVVCIDGNDGTGKSTLVASLTLRFPDVRFQDRGAPTAMTDGKTGDAADLYLILDAPVEVCQRRLRAAGRSLEEPFHTASDLAHYRSRFLDVAARLGAVVLDASGDLEAVISAAVRVIERHRLADGAPRAHLQ